MTLEQIFYSLAIAIMIFLLIFMVFLVVLVYRMYRSYRKLEVAVTHKLTIAEQQFNELKEKKGLLMGAALPTVGAFASFLFTQFIKRKKS